MTPLEEIAIDRERLIEMARHNIAHVKADSIEQAEEIAKVPSDHYTDAARWNAERDRVFKELPLVLALSTELANPGDYRALNVLEVPVLLVRDADGVARAFVNMCSHRGARLVEEGAGNATRFSCPYHGWTYTRAGDLFGVASPKDFGVIDKRCYGLTRLPTFERAGLIWVVLNPASTLDFDGFLSGYAASLGAFGFEHWHVFGRKQLSSANWKLTYDGYLDFYHLPVLHKLTFKAKFSNRALSYQWGPHQRVVTPDPTLLKLETAAPEAWDLKHMLKGVWTIFPNVAFISVDGRGTAMMMSQIFPGGSVGESFSQHTFITERELTTEEERRAAEEQFSFLVKVLREEDYPACRGIQANLLSGARDHVLFGRNEMAGQVFHRWLDRLVQADGGEARNALFR
ncbi:aromatic ring-hydroxylating oxygenase subunit alpha [Peristeroidobacter soli]|uniref:aromatic ring-hydroxylating oxygenase subunit alpha n=1 Tax=Peristeroidobacter soli TaxID=2497877 RepID=UPI00101C886C|nr:aromatic ring-hydroxylating dioxygenase subunit alpha [Peristeroidobacter soli]